MQFRALDKAGNASAWAPATADPAAEAMVDTLPPSLPVLTGGSSGWQNAAQVVVQPTGTPTDAGSGFAGYEYRTSTDGGATWSAPTSGPSAAITAEGTTLVEFRSLDTLGNASAWTGVNGQVQIDRTPPTAPIVTGGSASWLAGPSVSVNASGATDQGAGVTGYEFETSTNGGTHLVRGHRRPDRGHLDAGHDARALRGGRRRRAPVAVDAGDGQARPHRPVGAHRLGRLLDVGERRLGHDHRERLDRHRRLRASPATSTAPRPTAAPRGARP